MRQRTPCAPCVLYAAMSVFGLWFSSCLFNYFCISVNKALHMRGRVARIGEKAWHFDRAVEFDADESGMNARPSTACYHNVARFGSFVKESKIEGLDIHDLDVFFSLKYASELIGCIVCMTKHADAKTAQVVEGQSFLCRQGTPPQDINREGRRENRQKLTHAAPSYGRITCLNNIDFGAQVCHHRGFGIVEGADAHDFEL